MQEVMNLGLVSEWKWVEEMMGWVGMGADNGLGVSGWVGMGAGDDVVGVWVGMGAGNDGLCVNGRGPEYRGG